MALFQKKRRTADVKRGPIVACVENLTKLLPTVRQLLWNQPVETKPLWQLLAFPVRCHKEESLRGALFHALTHSETNGPLSFCNLETAVRALSVLSEESLVQSAIQCPDKARGNWNDLERAHFCALQRDLIHKSIQPPSPDQEPIAQIEAAIGTMAEYCQADSVQKNARESFLMAHVPW